MFHQSSLTFAQAKTKIARAASAEADTDMLTKAGDALESAFQKWNNRRHWNFLLTQSEAIPIIAPLSLVGVTLNAASTTITGAAGLFDDVAVYDIISHANIPPGSYVASTPAQGGTTMVISSLPLASGTATLTAYRRDFALLSDFNYIYSVKLLNSGQVLTPIDDRLYHIINPTDEPTTPSFYTLFKRGDVGLISLVPTPTVADNLLVKYYKRMTVPSVDGTALNIPIDFEWGVLAEAKAIFLAEKGGYDAVAAFWAAKAEEALAAAVLADNKHPDEDVGFLPGFLRTAAMYPQDTIRDTDVY